MPAPLEGWDFWRAIGSPSYVTAPMVKQSELAFRSLTRQLGSQLCYTPMIHALNFVEAPIYRRKEFETAEDDSPLFGQLAGHDPAVVLEAARLLEPNVSAVDLNFGCPQMIASRGRYGSFLLEEPETCIALVRTLAQSSLQVPVTAKIRLRPSFEATSELCRGLQDAGASVICVHGRTARENKQLVGDCSWESIAHLVSELDIPVIANGGVATIDEAERCLKATGAAAVMSSEALLENPGLFCGNRDPATDEYLDQVRNKLLTCDKKRFSC